MLKDAFYLARKDTRYLFRSWEVWFWAFAMPVVFFYFIGSVTGGMSRPSPGVEHIGLHVSEDAGVLADQLVRRLEGLGYQVDRVDEAGLESYRRRLTIPAGFTKSVLAGEQAKVVWNRTGEGLGADYDRIRVTRAVYAVLADWIVVHRQDGDPAPEAFEALAAEERALTLDVKPAGERRQVPSGFEQSVPGTMVMFVLLVLFTIGGVTLNQERNQGILRRLASAPMSRGAVVLGKWASRMFLGTIQITFAMITGSVLFSIDWGPNLAALAPVLIAYAGLAASGGMLLGNLGRTEGQVVGLGVICSNVLAALGGCWWPIEVTPMWAQRLSIALPTGWAMDAMHKLVSFGAQPTAVIPHMVAMTLAALLAGWVVARSLRFQ